MADTTNATQTLQNLLQTTDSPASQITIDILSRLEIGQVIDGIMVVDMDHFVSGKYIASSPKGYIIPHGKIVVLSDNVETQRPVAEIVYKNVGNYGRPVWEYVYHQEPDAKLDSNKIF